MNLVKLVTMVKDEVDIVKDWIIYHGKMFGYHNLYIVDNYSTDGTYDVCRYYEKNHGMYLTRRESYGDKGSHMHHIIKDIGPRNYKYAWPIDMDELVISYDINQHTVSPVNVVPYLNKIYEQTDYGVYKANYIGTKITREGGHDQAIRQVNRGTYHNYGASAKTFYRYSEFKTTDHGNHHIHGNHSSTDKYMETSLCLVHYHARSLEQVKQKTINNCTGFGYSTQDVDSLKQLLANNPSTPGCHHVDRMIKILENKFTICHDSTDTGVDLTPVIKWVSDP